MNYKLETSITEIIKQM